MEDSIEKCITSFIKCHCDEIELILVDDGSIDGSLEKCLLLAEKDERIKVIHQENSGSGVARNSGIKQAQGDYLLFVDADDILDEKAFHILIEIVKKKLPDLVVFGYRLVSPSGRETVKKFSNRFFSGDEVRKDYCPFFSNQFEWAIQGAPWNKLFKASIVKENGVTYPDLRRHQDEVFISRYVNQTNSVYFIDKVLYTHFSNDVKKIWKKYPSNYYDIVGELYLYRREIIEKWNPENEKIRALAYSEYINNMFRVFYKLFDESKHMNYKQRKAYYEKIRESFIFRSYSYPKEYIGLVKRMQNYFFVLFFTKRNYRFLDLLVRFRLAVFVQSK